MIIIASKERQSRNHAPAGHEVPGARRGVRRTRDRSRSGGMLPSAKAATSRDSFMPA